MKPPRTISADVTLHETLKHDGAAVPPRFHQTAPGGIAARPGA